MALIKLTQADGLADPPTRATIRSEDVSAVVLRWSQTGSDGVIVNLKSGEAIGFACTTDAASIALFAKIEGAL